MDSEDKGRKIDPNGEESASDRLRRILASRAHPEQKITGISSQPAPVEPQSAQPHEDFPLDDDSAPQPEQVPLSVPDQKKTRRFWKDLMGILADIWQFTRNFLSSLFSGKKKNKRNHGSDQREKRKFLNIKDKKSCLIYSVLGMILIGIIIAIVILSFLIIQYFRIAADLPSVENLADYASKFETTRIYDRNGNLIYEIIDPNAGRRTYVPLDEISPYVIAATIATEDKDFFTNPGFDPWGIMRALWQNYTSGRVVSGASTITQQLARTLLLSPEERTEVSTRRKAREIVLAAEITRKYSKYEILELYLNENNYGNLAYGIEAAAETYFNTSADQLDLAQSSFLAGLPQAPAIYDIFTNREASLLRQLDVLNLMYQLSTEESCISTVPSQPPVCVSMDDAVAAAQAIEN